MRDRLNKNFRFNIECKTLSEILKIDGKGYKIAGDAVSAQEAFYDLVKKADLDNQKHYDKFFKNRLSNSTLGNYISKNELNTQGLKYILLLFFLTDTALGKEELKKLFNELSFSEGYRAHDIAKAFNPFFEAVEDILRHHKIPIKYTLRFNAKVKAFEIDEGKEEEKKKEDKKAQFNNYDQKKLVLIYNDHSKQDDNIDAENKPKSKNILFISLLVVISAIVIFKTIDFFDSTIQKEENFKIIELSKKTEKIRNDELTALYSLIYDELTSDYLEDNKRNLSDNLIAKIITMSEKFRPYLYEVDSKIIKKPLSKERAQLFVSLVRYNLDLDTYNEIFRSANFTSSDFSYMNLSDLNFGKDLYGLYGNYKNEVIGLITTSERANLSNSYFYKTNLDKTTIVGILNGCEFEEVNFHETNFNWVELIGSIFENNTLDHVLFNNSNLEGSNFRNSINIGENKGFVNCNLRGVNFDNSTFSGVGYEPFVFKSCFLSTKNLFFEYDFYASKSAIGLSGNPFIEESPLWSKDFYYAYRNLDFNSNEKVSLKVIDSTFKFIGNKKQEETFLKTINSDSSYSKFNYYKVRINDNDNRNSKSFEHLISFDTIRFGIEDLKGDTLQVLSSLNKIEYRYRNYSTYLNPVATTEEKTSFKNCSFNFTTFKDSTMEFVDFSGAVFKNPKNTIKNNFINCSFYLNDFRIKDGLFFIDKLSSLDSVIVNLKFPPLVFKEQISKINTQNYRNYKISKSKDSMHIDTFYDQVDMKIKWAEYVNRKMVLDTFDFNNQEAMLLRKTF